MIDHDSRRGHERRTGRRVTALALGCLAIGAVGCGSSDEAPAPPAGEAQAPGPAGPSRLLNSNSAAERAESEDPRFVEGRRAYSAREYGKAMTLWLPLAESGDAHAQNNVGKLFYLGQGVEQDYDEAFRWFRKAADNGAEMAYLSLCVMSIKGEGTEYDPVEAYKWLVLAEGVGHSLPTQVRSVLIEELTPEQQAAAEEAARTYQEEHPRPS